MADTHDWLLFFTDRGRVYRKRCFDVAPDISKQTRGTPLVNLIEKPQNERVTSLVALPDLQADMYILLATRRGELKRMHLSQLANIRSNGLTAMDLEKDDMVMAVRLADPGSEIIMVSRMGQGIRFALDQVRVRQTRSAGGVRGIRLAQGDEVIAMDVAVASAHLLTLTERGYGKRTPVTSFPLQGRLGQGVIASRITDKTGLVAAATVVTEEVEEITVGSSRGMVFRTRLSEIPGLGRATQGVMVMTKLLPGDRVISVSCLAEREEEEEKKPTPPKRPSAQRNGHVTGQTPRQLAMEVVAPEEAEEDDEEEGSDHQNDDE